MASASEWQQRVEAWKASGESASEFAARAGWKPRTLAWWASRLRRAGGPPSVEFVRVVAAEPPESGPTLEVVLAGGRVVRVGRGFDAELLRAVVAALESG